MPRGGYIHNRVLLDPLERRARSLGFATARELLVAPGRRSGYADLVIDIGAGQVLVEAELGTRRIARDLSKAVLLGAVELWIVVPDAKVGRGVQGRLQAIPRQDFHSVFVLLFSQAMTRVMLLGELFSRSNVGKEIKSEMGQTGASP